MEKLNDLVEALYPQYGALGSRDVDISARRKAIDESAAVIAEAFRALEQENSELRQQRAGLAKEANGFEAKLAELERQEPVAYSWRSLKKAQLTRTMPESWKQPRDIKPLFTRPAPAIDLAELVPDSDVQASIDKLKNGYFRRWIKEYSSKEAKSGYVAGSINVKDIVNVFNYADACAAILRNIEEAK